jgi:CAAX prenyl protease-like protein
MTTTMQTGPTGRPNEIAYCVPAVVFAVATALEGYAPEGLYPLAYAAKAAAVAAALYVCRAIFADLRWSPRILVPAVAVGLGVFALWVGVEQYVAYPHLGERSGYNPFETLSPGAAFAFIAVRLAGLIVMVPIFEELLWRSFLIRYVTSPDFQSVAHGTFTTTALLVVSGAAAISHTEWLSGFHANVVYCLLLRQTRSVLACVIAHAVTNAVLGIYVLTIGSWQLW